ncbi:unnamed protein product [Agarophyton chilense]|eukprot:gb/GEZJ01003547.1/.p1 GENE.gb/GEZJ01003547.1/~~gb/GEZJ01003547.1/.p1  ORF type:complete len:1175 (-),score=149.33 gb/GEZJ01003547.1/:380-3904(-)
MPRSVYIVKGEGVRDSVWTPKTGVASPSTANLPELVQTVPSPNFSVNPIVQVFLHPSTPVSRAAESTPGLLVPNNAASTRDVAPLCSSTVRSLHASSGVASRQPNPPASLVSPKAPKLGNVSSASRAAGTAMTSLSIFAPGEGIQTHRQNRPRRMSQANGARKPFPAYNCSPMVSAVVVKQAEPVKSANRPPPLQVPLTTLGRTHHRSLVSTVGRQEEGQRSGMNTEVHIPGSNTRKPSFSGLKTKFGDGRKEKSKSPLSPKESLRVSRIMCQNEALYKETRKVMGDMVQRRMAHQREKSAEKSPPRPLTPLSKLGEDFSVHKMSSSLDGETTAACMDRTDGGKEIREKSFPKKISKTISNDVNAPKTVPVQVMATNFAPKNEHDVSSIARGGLNTAVGDVICSSPRDKSSNRHFGMNQRIGAPKQHTSPIHPSKTSFLSAKKSGHEGSGISSTRHISSQVDVSGAGSPQTKVIARASRFTHPVDPHDATVPSRTNRSGIHAIGAHSAEERSRGRQLERRNEMRIATIVGEQYSLVIRSLFALAAEARKEGRTRNGLSGTDLKIFVKQRVLTAFVSQSTEKASGLNKTASKLLKQLERYRSGGSPLKRVRKAEVEGAPQASCRSSKDEVTYEDLRGLKNVLLSWERYRNQVCSSDEFHADVNHIKCVGEAIQDGVVSLSDFDAFQHFKDLSLVHTGVELIYNAINGLKTTYKGGNYESCRAWFRSTDNILTWLTVMKNRMKYLLTVKNELLERDLKKYCKESSKGLTDGSDSNRGEGTKMGRKLRELKQLIKNLWEDKDKKPIPIQDKYCSRTTEQLNSEVKLFVSLLKAMKVYGSSELYTDGEKAERSGSSSREGSPEAPVQNLDDNTLRTRKSGSAFLMNAATSSKHGERKGFTNKGTETKKVLVDGGVEQGVAKAGVSGYVRPPADDIARRDGTNKKGSNKDVAVRKQQERGRKTAASSTITMKQTIPLSIPRRPLKAGSDGNSTRANILRSHDTGAAPGRGMGKTGPAATVQNMLAKSIVPTPVKSRKRKRGDGILQNHDKEELDNAGMRAKRRKQTKIRFRREPEVLCGPPKNFATLSTLFNDGENWLTNDNEVQKAAISDRNARLSRETVSTWFSFLRAFIWQQKCSMSRFAFAMPRFLPTPYTPSAVRELSRTITGPSPSSTKRKPT